jgi:2-methylcitrate dehydratase PrpD
LTRGLGRDFTNLNVTMKPYPCCKGTHAYVALALDMVKQHQVRLEDVSRITVFNDDPEYFLVHPLEKRRRPETPVDSQFSIPWAVAAVFARGRAGIGEFTEAAIESPDILGISSRIHVEEDKNVGEHRKIAARIELLTGQGRWLVGEFRTAVDDVAAPLPFADYERKFRDCALYAVSPRSKKQIDKIVSLVKRLDRLDDVRELLEPLS